MVSKIIIGYKLSTAPVSWTLLSSETSRRKLPIVSDISPSVERNGDPPEGHLKTYWSFRSLVGDIKSLSMSHVNTVRKKGISKRK